MINRTEWRYTRALNRYQRAVAKAPLAQVRPYPNHGARSTSARSVNSAHKKTSRTGVYTHSRKSLAISASPSAADPNRGYLVVVASFDHLATTVKTVGGDVVANMLLASPEHRENDACHDVNGFYDFFVRPLFSPESLSLTNLFLTHLKLTNW